MKRTTQLKKQGTGWIILGHLSFMALFLASVYFYKERILFADSAFQFFKIINFEKFNVEAARYGSVLPEIPLLMAVKLGLNLKMLTIIYSVSFIGLYYLVFILCVHWLKNPKAGLAVVLTLILCISQSFFHPVTETHQSLVYSVLLFAILQYPSFRHPASSFLLAALVIIIAFLAHPVAVYPIIFIIGYSAIDRQKLRSPLPYALLLIAGGLAVAKVLLTRGDTYEGRFFSELLNSFSALLSITDLYSTKFFFSRIPQLYLWLLVMQAILVVYLIYKKDYLKLTWQAATLLFFMLITMLTYNKGDSDLMMERAFMPLALFVSIPFLKEISGKKKKFQTLIFIFLAFVMVFSMDRIYDQGMAFKGRTWFNQQMLLKTSEYPGRKIIVESSELQKHQLIFWSHSFETLILSTITAATPTQTIFPANHPDQLGKYLEGATDVFLGADFWLEWSIHSLNPKYFTLPTDLPYVWVKTDEW